jgi:hypothetical protein
MKKVIRLTESDLTRIITRVLEEQDQPDLSGCIKGISTPPQSCNGTDARQCIKELGRMVYTTNNPETIGIFADSIKCLTNIIKQK